MVTPRGLLGCRLERHQYQERHQHRARPVRDLIDVKGKPAGQQHDFDRHQRHRPPWHHAPQRERDPGEHIAAPRAAARQDRGAGARHMRRIDRVARRLQREIRLDRGARVEFAAEEQRPPAIRALGGAQISCDALFELRVDRAEIVLQEDVLGRDRGVGFQVEHPVAVLLLQRQEQFDRSRDGGIEARRADRLAERRRTLLLC